MAAEILRHQSSRAYYDHHHGFLWRFLHFLDLDRHRHRRKMPNYRRFDLDDDDKHRGGTTILTSEQSDNEQLLDKEANFQVENENKINATKKSSGSTHLITLLYKKMTRKKNKKLKNSSSAARLLRTISIHHLECDDYVLPDEISLDSESSTVEVNSHEMDFSAISKQGYESQNNSPSILNNDKDFLDCSMDLNKKIKDAIKEEHRISLDGVLDKVPVGHKLGDDVQREESRGGDSPRSKFGSEGFVSTNSKLAHRTIQRSRSLTESLDRYSHLLESSSLKELQKLPQRLNSTRAQDDSLAHRKVLRSRSLSESLGRYSHLLEFISGREPQRLHQRSNSVSEQDNKFANGRVLRSHSLSESFDRYHLLESLSTREPQKLLQRLNSTKEQESNSAHRRVQRSRSLSESFDRCAQLPDSVSVRESKRQPERLKSIQEEDGLQDIKSQTVSGSILSISELGSVSFANDGSGEKLALSPKKADWDLLGSDEEADNPTPNDRKLVDILVNTEESIEQPELKDECDQNEATIVSHDLIADDNSSIAYNEQQTEIKQDEVDKPSKSSPLSVLDSCFEEEAISPAKYDELRADAELKSSHIPFEAEFNYMRDVLDKFGFCGGAEEFLEAWSSSYEPIDQLLFVEELQTTKADCDEIPWDRQLFLDLINEALLEIYESTIAYTLGLSRFSSHIMPVNMGDHLLEQVWAKISRLLRSQQDMNHALEDALARDYAKDDGWMKLHLDVERVGMDLEGLILDDLVEEVILDFGYV